MMAMECETEAGVLIVPRVGPGIANRLEAQMQINAIKKDIGRSSQKWSRLSLPHGVKDSDNHCQSFDPSPG
jgi:hypothetical protein